MTTTNVAFAIDRDDPHREVIAIMPGEASTIGRPDLATYYASVGWLGACSVAGILATHEQAEPVEFADLLAELQHIGYTVHIIPLERIGGFAYEDDRRKQLDEHDFIHREG